MKRGLLWLAAVLALGQTAAPDFVCPMDPEIHRNTPGRCPRCGMALVAKLPAFEEYPVVVTTQPHAPRPGQPITLRMQVLEPHTKRAFSDLTEVHEKLMHLFLVSEDLNYFAHEHPLRRPDGSFGLQTTLPKAGMYRLLCDFYPAGGRPQIVARSLILPGAVQSSAPLTINTRPQSAVNVSVTLRTEPEQPLAGKETLLFFHLDPGSQIEPYLGAWGHLLAASADLIDMIHTHPTIGDRGPDGQFNLIFPRPGLYRLWLQTQRAGIVNTVSFTIPVKAL